MTDIDILEKIEKDLSELASCFRRYGMMEERKVHSLEKLAACASPVKIRKRLPNGGYDYVVVDAITTTPGRTDYLISGEKAVEEYRDKDGNYHDPIYVVADSSTDVLQDAYWKACTTKQRAACETETDKQ